MKRSIMNKLKALLLALALLAPGLASSADQPAAGAANPAAKADLAQAISDKVDAGKIADMIRAGADVNQASNGLTPLLVASVLGNTDVMKLLIKNGAKVN